MAIVYFPGLYIYAIHRLIAIVDKHDVSSEEVSEHGAQIGRTKGRHLAALFEMHKSIKYPLILTLPILVLVTIGIVSVTVHDGPSVSPVPREGSIEHARLWRNQLLDCNSISDIQKTFNSVILVEDVNGLSCDIDPNTLNPGKYSATVYDFMTGDWIAIITAEYNTGPSGYTVVTYDSHRSIRMYFGCFYPPFVDVTSVNDVYSRIEAQDWKEIKFE